MIKSKFYNREYNNALVSIIMPAYNSERYIEDAIQSVICQTYKEWELLVIDDGSIDYTAALVEAIALKESRVKLFKLKTNKGVAVARNKGLEQAKGRYIAFLDSDDLWLPQKLEKQLKYMKEERCAFCFHNYYIAEGAISNVRKTINVPYSIDYVAMLKNNCTGGCLTTVLDRNVIRDIYMPIYKHEDYLCWLDILKKYKPVAKGLPEVLGCYRVGHTSVSNNKFRSALWRWRAYRIHGLNFICSAYYFCWYVFSGIYKHIIW